MALTLVSRSNACSGSTIPDMRTDFPGHGQELITHIDSSTSASSRVDAACQGFEAVTVCLDNGDGEVSGPAHVEIANNAGLALVRAGNDDALVTILDRPRH